MSSGECSVYLRAKQARFSGKRCLIVCSRYMLLPGESVPFHVQYHCYDKLTDGLLSMEECYYNCLWQSFPVLDSQHR